jgi:RNA polymerase sigma factor (sigma-70 family)
MPGGPSSQVFKDLEVLFRFGVVGELSDGQLLDQFVTRRGEAAEDAFTVLVQRHGPMVLGTCKRILNNAHEAEDAFQATFLVLARKAATIARRETLAAWLYGVALRTAKDARSRSLRRKAREARVSERESIDSQDGEPPGELRTVIDEELAKLPEHFRAAVLLCELEGLSREEAAARLKIPEGTLSSRLARAKGLLRDRLARRGLGVSTVALTSALAEEARAAVVPLALAELTVRAATSVAAGSCVAGMVSASVSSLTEEVLKAMLFAKLKGLALGLLAIGLTAYGAFATGAIAVAQVPPPASSEPSFTKTANFPGAPGDSDRLQAVEQKLDRILEALGKTGASTPPPGPASLPVGTDRTARVRFHDGQAAPSSANAPRAEPPSPDAVPGSGSRADVAFTLRVDRLTLLEQRLAQVERRLNEIEKRLDGTGAQSGTEPELPPSPVRERPPLPR